MSKNVKRWLIATAVYAVMFWLVPFATGPGDAYEAAKEFMKRVDAMRTEEKNRKSAQGEYYYDSPKHRGAVRRSSMELTRALAQMRKYS